MNCPFCDPLIEHAVFAQSENFLAIYSIAPILPGHSLIIPKKHRQSVMEFNDSELTQMIVFTRNVTDLLLHAFKAESFNWSLQDMEAAGQTIAHLHLHVVPRYPGDLPDPGDWYPKIKNNYKEVLDSQNRKKLSEDEMVRIINRLRELAQKRLLYKPV